MKSRNEYKSMTGFLANCIITIQTIEKYQIDRREKNKKINEVLKEIHKAGISTKKFKKIYHAKSMEK